MDDDFDYLPQDAAPYGYAPPYGNYPDAAGGWPNGRHRATGQQPGGAPGPANGTWQGGPAGEPGVPGYPPQGPGREYGYPASRAPQQAYQPGSRPTPAYRPGTGAMPAYQQPGPGPMPGYGPGTGPMRTYQGDSGPMRAYQGDSGPMRTYRPDSGPMRAYQPNSGPMPAYQPNSGPMPTYRPAGGPPVADGGYPAPGGYPGAEEFLEEFPGASSYPRTAAGGYKRGSSTLLLNSQSAGGAMAATQAPPSSVAYRTPPAGGAAGSRPLAGWLPFTNRLVLLPKEGADDEELREHRDIDGGGWLRPAVFGAMDGLVTNASLIAGIGGGGVGHATILLTGVAGIIAGAFSMATGEYISVGSQNELTLAEVELERKQHARDPEGKQARLTEIYMEKGVSPNLAEAVVRQISADPEKAIDAHIREELGIDPDDLPSPRTAAVASFASFTVGALLPLSPFLIGINNLTAGLAIAGVSAFVGGAALSKITGRPAFMGGFRQFTAAFLATGMAFLIGHLVGAHVG